MKRFVAILMVLLAATTLFASTEFTFSGTYALIGANGRTIRRTKTEVNDGLFIATGKAPAAASAEKYNLFLRDNSLVAVTEVENQTIIYLIYGIASVVIDMKLANPLVIYTPTTLTEVSAKGEYCVISTDENEIFYNFSAHALRPYDAIRGTNVNISATKGFDYIHNKSIALDYAYRMSVAEQEEIIRIPAAPVFTSPLQKVLDSIPSKPQFAEVDQNLVTTGTPSKPEFEEMEQKLLDVPNKPTFEEVTEKLLNSTPNTPSFLKTKMEVVETPVKPVEITVTQVLED